MLRRCWPWIVALPLLGSCRATPIDCEDDSTERCLWEQALREPITADKDPGQEDLSNDASGSLTADSKLDQTLTEMIELMRAGLEWSLIDTRALALCKLTVDGQPVVTLAPADDDGDGDGTSGSSKAWYCDTDLLIETQSLTLEASAGVLSLTAAPLDEPASAALLELARARFEPWCASDFEDLEGANHLVFYRCALPEGPYLVVARFPRDLETNEWQVSLAILDTG